MKEEIKELVDLDLTQEQLTTEIIGVFLDNGISVSELIAKVVDLERTHNEHKMTKLRLSVQEGIHGADLKEVERFPIAFANMFCTYFPKAKVGSASQLGIEFFEAFERGWLKYIKKNDWVQWAKEQGYYETLIRFVK